MLLLYGPPGGPFVSVDDFALATVPTGPDEAEDRHLQTSTSYGITPDDDVIVAAALSTASLGKTASARRS
jgi:hypothetical protein